MDHVEPKQEVSPELAARHRGVEVAMGGGDDAGRHGKRALSADPLELAILECSQELALQQGVEIADLVEEERPARRLFEPADPLAHGTGERSSLVAEELTLDHRRGEGRTIHVDEGPRRAQRERMETPRDDSLPDAGLTRHKDRGVCRSGALQLPAQLLHRGALTDELARNARLRAARPQERDAGHDLVRWRREANDVRDPAPEEPDDAVHRQVPREHDHRAPAKLLAEGTEALRQVLGLDRASDDAQADGSGLRLQRRAEGSNHQPTPLSLCPRPEGGDVLFLEIEQQEDQR
ncbi:MAG TPA: hypothetical protein VMW35_01315 [Myxococcota bacterium]|nr:hypothetical protein [Myxococcota bacterium]